jgi:hypothetical protein
MLGPLLQLAAAAGTYAYVSSSWPSDVPLLGALVSSPVHLVAVSIPSVGRLLQLLR